MYSFLFSNRLQDAVWRVIVSVGREQGTSGKALPRIVKRHVMRGLQAGLEFRKAEASGGSLAASFFSG